MTAIRLKLAAGVLGCALLAAGCGSSSSTTSVAPPPSDPKAPATGTLSVFAYQDSITDELLDPFRKANPDLDLKTAGFGSNDEAAAKMAGGFRADVVESCLDEMSAFTERDLLRPLDPTGITDWNDLVFRDSAGVRDADGGVLVVPLSAGPQGLIYDASAIPPGEIDSFTDLFDPAYADETALEADYPLPAIAETALALGIEDPMNLTPEQLDQVTAYLIDHKDQFRSLWRSDADVVNLFKSGEIELSDGGPGLAERIRNTGVDARWVAPKERPLSWVCGFSLTSDAQNTDAAYKLINWLASPEAQAIRADDGYVVTNPKAVPLADPEARSTADPKSIADAIPETEPPDYQDWVRAFREFQAE